MDSSGCARWARRASGAGWIADPGARSRRESRRPQHPLYAGLTGIRGRDANALCGEATRSPDCGGGSLALRLLILGTADTLWRSIGLAQMGAAELVAARQACERQTRAALGDTAYEAAYTTGREMHPEDGVAHALTTPPYGR